MAVYVVKKALASVVAAGGTHSASTVFRVEEISFNYPTAETQRRPTGAGSMGMGKTFVGGIEGSISMTFPLKGSGATGPHTKPDFDLALQMCGMRAVGVGSGGSETGWNYFPSNSDVSLYDVLVQVQDQDSGNSYQVALDNAVGNLTIEGQRNGPLLATVEARGVFVVPTKATDLALSSMDTTVAQNFKGVSVDLHAETGLVCDSYSFDLGNEIVMRPSLSDSQGYLSAMILSRSPSGTINPEVPDPATFDIFTEMINETLDQLDFGDVGGTAGNIVTVTHPNAQIVGATLGERNGILTADIELHFAETFSASGGSQDEIKIAFT